MLTASSYGSLRSRLPAMGSTGRAQRYGADRGGVSFGHRSLRMDFPSRSVRRVHSCST
jgi:hypothetical protein